VHSGPDAYWATHEDIREVLEEAAREKRGWNLEKHRARYREQAFSSRRRLWSCFEALSLRGKIRTVASITRATSKLWSEILGKEDGKNGEDKAEGKEWSKQWRKAMRDSNRTSAGMRQLLEKAEQADDYLDRTLTTSGPGMRIYLSKATLRTLTWFTLDRYLELDRTTVSTVNFLAKLRELEITGQELIEAVESRDEQKLQSWLEQPKWRINVIFKHFALQTDESI
jgi:hypothetical protein